MSIHNDFSPSNPKQQLERTPWTVCDASHKCSQPLRHSWQMEVNTLIAQRSRTTAKALGASYMSWQHTPRGLMAFSRAPTAYYSMHLNDFVRLASGKTTTQQCKLKTYQTIGRTIWMPPSRVCQTAYSQR